MKALQISASSRLAAGSSKLAPGAGVARVSSAAASCATRKELGGAGPADQAMRRLLQADQGVRVAAARRLDHDGQDFEAAREAGDEAPAAFVDDFLNLSRRERRGCRKGEWGPSG